MTWARCVCLGVDFEPEDLVRWYHVSPNGEVVIIAISSRVSRVQIRRCPRDHVFWWPEGGRGVTEPLEKAVNRLRMLREPSG